MIGPENSPYLVDPVRAADCPEPAVAFAATHGNEEGKGDDVLQALVSGVGPLTVDSDGAPVDRYVGYLNGVFALLSEEGRKVRETMTQNEAHRGGEVSLFRAVFRKELAEAKAELRTELEAEAEAKVGAEVVLKVLHGRGVAVSDDVRERVLGTADVQVLDRWLLRAATANSVEELFAEPSSES